MYIREDRILPNLHALYLLAAVSGLSAAALTPERQRGEAREQLRTAHSMLQGMGMAAFAERSDASLPRGVPSLRRRVPAEYGSVGDQVK